MSILSILLTILGVLAALVLGAIGTAIFVGRRLVVSWKKPYKRATDSLLRMSHSSMPLLQDFTRHPQFRQWLHREGRKELRTLAVLFCTAEEQMQEYVRAALPKSEQKRLHGMIKQKRSFTKEEVERAIMVIRSHLEEEYRKPEQQRDLSLAALCFRDEYGDCLQYIAKQQRLVDPALQETISRLVSAVLHSIPFYRERRMYEQQHKLEMFLTKDLPDMLSLMAQLSPRQRLEKEQELAAFLIKFQKEIEQSESSMYHALEHALDVKMRAAEEKLNKN